MPANTIPKRKRGPHKGDGGRPRGTLRDDFPDNMIVAVSLWLSKGGKRAVSVPFLEYLIYMFDDGDFVKTPDDGIGLVTRRGGVPTLMVSALKNIRPARVDGANYPDGSLRQTPDGRTLMKRRVQFIKDKIRKHMPPKSPKGLVWIGPRPGLTQDQVWLSACFVGLDFLLAGQKERAMIAFGHAGWPLGPGMEGLNQFLNLTVVNITL
jgi:hypothetical protein